MKSKTSFSICQPGPQGSRNGTSLQERVIRRTCCASVPANLPTTKVWLQERAALVAKVLMETALGQPRTEQRVLQVMAELCTKWRNSQLPYGVLLGWVFQTGHQVIIFEHVQENGRLTKYVMPQLELGESRKDQLSRICQEGRCLPDAFVLQECKSAEVGLRAWRDCDVLGSRGCGHVRSEDKPHLAVLVHVIKSQLRGLDGMVQLLKEKKVWEECGVNLTGLAVKTASVAEANMALLRRFGFLDSFYPVMGAVPFSQDEDIVGKMVLKELQVMPPGCRMLFPFDHDRLANKLADLLWFC